MTFWELLTIVTTLRQCTSSMRELATKLLTTHFRTYSTTSSQQEKYQAGCPVFMFFLIMLGPPIKMSACLEVVQHRVLQYLWVSFMIPGHTKFASDVLFAKITKVFYAADVFNEAELKLIAEQFGLVILDNGGIVRTWREKVGEKYTSLPGIWELHDLVTVAMPPDKVVMKVRERCYAGALRDLPTKVKCGFCANGTFPWG